MKAQLILAVAATALAAPLAAQRPGAFLVEETGESFDTLQDAVSAIGGRRGTIRIASGRYGDCAVQEAGEVAFVAEKQGTAVFDGGACEGKATLVLRGRSARVEGLVFTGIAVEDGNGAGIRIEQGDLHVSYTRFVDSQSGILSARDPSRTITVDHSTFSGLGENSEGVHSIYIGQYGALTVTNCRFERGTGGHYVKSRAPRIAVLGSSFDDSHGRATNYMIDLPDGAVGRIADNVFVQGKDKDNYSTLIAVAAEDKRSPSRGLIIEDNSASVAPGFRGATTFVRDWSGEPLIIRNNRLGSGITPFARQ
ncbi:MAG TPA: right-handed parallel beta-helix repeat-containing protein [Allosphingosinicella sp.]|jgi:hypothetical protein